MKIKIKSLDKFLQNYEKEFLVTKFVDLFGKKEYHYVDEYGKCKIVDFGDFLEIYRQGQIDAKQVFKIKKHTTFFYRTNKFLGKYKIFTKKFENKDEKIMLEYDIMNKDELINNIKLEICFMEK